MAKVKVVVDNELGNIEIRARIFEEKLIAKGEMSENMINHQVKLFIKEEMRELRELRKNEKREPR